MMPADVLSVAALIVPIANGLMKPEALPIELARAIPVAAAAPVRIAGGSVQYMEIVVITPMVARQSAGKLIIRFDWKTVLTRKPVAASTPGTAKCQRRSRYLSELLPTRIMHAVASA